MEQKILEKLESMDAKFSNQISALDKKFTSEFKKVNKTLNQHNKILNEHTEQIDFIANKVAEHDTDIQEIKIYLKEEVATKKDLERIYTSLDEILSHVKKNDQEITFMGNRITRLEKQASIK